MAITKGAIVEFAGADTSGGSVTSSSFDSTGGGLLVFGVVHEGAPTTYTFTDSKSGANWTVAAEQDNTTVNDLSLAVGYCWSPNVGTGHTVTCTFGASRPFRYIGGIVLNGTFASAAILAATTQQAQGTGTSVDAGSLVTDAAAFLIQFVGNYAGVTLFSPPPSGWTNDANTVGGRNYQTRNEATSGTFDPVCQLAASGDWCSIAAAFKEAGGGAVFKPRAMLLGVG